jgi:hypothetical protein
MKLTTFLASYFLIFAASFAIASPIALVEGSNVPENV